MKKTVMLLIMDGFGIAEKSPRNAISCAKTPNLDSLFSNYPNSLLFASGKAVGLPEGQMGNSEVGHTNMGAGRVVWQELSRITNSIEDGSFYENEELKKCMMTSLKKDKALHLIGLLSDGGVHSHNSHLYALLEMAKRLELSKVYVHCILDGRDVPPLCSEKYLKELEEKIQKIGVGHISDICGRFYAMDRDKRWDRVEKAYNLYTLGDGKAAENFEEAIKLARSEGENDEFVKPVKISKGFSKISDGDSVIFFNFRPDRAREISSALSLESFDGFERKVKLKDLSYCCFTKYDENLKGVTIAFKPQSLKNTLGEYVSSLGKTQLRIAETEKYAHVTFFFNGGREENYIGEDRILVPSPKVATYDLKPEMSAREVTEKVLLAISSGNYDLIIMNLANCDMVGHTGVFDAAVKAVETVDECVGKISDAILSSGGKLLVTADHGNADEMLDEKGNIVTSHSTNPVPLIYVAEDAKQYRLLQGSLCDLAPTLLYMMGENIPKEMEGKILLEK